MSSLLVATNNAGKLREISSIIADPSITLLTLSDVGITSDIEETGQTFEENSAMKAAAYARRAGLLTLADDSGLVIDHLGGGPGVRSARYAGEGASDADRIEKVLGEMKGSTTRTARFICVVTLSNPAGKIVESVGGRCEGTIVDVPRGSFGFGYDPIFLPDGFDKTFGELDAETKNRISHRAIALAKIIPFLRGFFEN